jgi:acyl-CoA synthetase (NDP forming)
MWSKELEAAFYPKVVAIIGISSSAKRDDPWAPGGAAFVNSIESLGFKGHLYIVNPKVDELLGYKCYPSISSIPEHIDLVIMAIPAEQVFAVLEDCIKVGAKNIHMFTAGFEETGEPEGKELGNRLKEVIARGGLNVIGPNCMGLYVPESGIGTFFRLPKKVGSVSFLSQSGGNLNWFAHYGPNYGFWFNKCVSFGNAYVLDSTDFLEYLGPDPKTKIICMYLEGVKNGEKLRRQVTEINRTKPVIILKAGLNEQSARAVASHTGSLAGQETVWNAFFRQTGAVQVNTLEEMAEMAMTFLYVKPLVGRRVAILGIGGGTSVAAAEVCAREGILVPALTEKTQNELRKVIPVAGSSVRNPLDTGLFFRDVTNGLTIELEAVASDPNIDAVILLPHLDLFGLLKPELIQETLDFLTKYAKNPACGKPMVMVFNSFMNEPWETEMRAKMNVELPQKGVPVYNSLQSAARCLARLAEYHRIQQEMKS